MGKKEREIQEAVANGEYGESQKFDPTFNGPLHNRSCTDVICLLIFVAFIVAWGVVGYLAFSNGDPSRIISPIDSEGNYCGVDSNVLDKPYLFYFDITKCLLPSTSNPFSMCNTPQVCVDACPDTTYVYIEAIGNEDSTICTHSFNKNSKNSTQIQAGIYEGRCTQWYIPTRNVAGHCVPLPNLDIDLHFNETLQVIAGTNLTSEKLQESSKVIQLLSQAKEVGESIVMDLKDSWPYIVGGLALSMLMCLIYIILMRWFAGIMVWFSLIGVIVLLAYCVYASYTKYSEMDGETTTDYGDGVVNQVRSILALRDTWLVFLIASSILLIIVVILVIFLRNRICIAVALIREASRAVGSVISTLAFPLVPWILQFGVIAWTVAVTLFLTGTSNHLYQITQFNETGCFCEGVNYTVGSSCTPHDFQAFCRSEQDQTCKDSFCLKIGSEVDSYVTYLHIFNLFGFFWGLFFMSAFGEMVLAGTFATWYWTFKKSDVPFFTLTYSILRTLRYNLGTLAFGSLILAICRMIRVILEYINNKLKKYDNTFVKIIMCCLRCCFWCLEKFIRFINRNAYIMCAIHGKNFCSSAKDAFNLLMRNIIRVFVLDKVTDFLLFLGKLMITAGMVALSFYFFGDKLQLDQIPELENAVPQLNYYFVPVIVIGIGSYFIASIFFGVYAMAVDTLFLCFLEDCERNDGSIEKPYFMSKHLMKILGKKNKKLKNK